jgi:hypothetical protein
MSSRLSSVFPRPSASDGDDVVWTLQTAAVQWQRGLRADAIVWVRKAADSATQLGQTARAEELRDHAARLAEFLWTDPEEPFEELDPGQLPLPRRQPGSRRVAGGEEPDELIEIEELEGYELEFSDTDLPTPDDAVADISAEDLTYYEDGEEVSEPTHVLPDDLDLRSDSERAPGSTRDSFLSVSPEADEADGYINAEPDSESVSQNSFLDSTPELREGPHIVAPISSESPTRPHIDKLRPSARAAVDEQVQGGRSPTLRSAALASPARPLLNSSQTLASAASVAVPLTAFSFPLTSRQPEVPAPAPDPPRVETPPPSAAAPAAVEHDPSQPPSVDGLAFESVEALADLPEEAQAELASAGKLLSLTTGQQTVLAEGAALITHGSVHVTLTFSDVSAARVGAGAVVAARGSIESGPLRLIADAPDTRVVTWSEAQLTQAMRDCPWVVDDLRLLADRFQAHASAGLGPLGARLDDALRAAVYERLQVRVLSPDECVAEQGKPLKGLFVVAVGELNVAAGAERGICAGEFLFPACVIGAEPAPHDVKAGPKGGLVLFATRPVAHELMMSVPPLLEILAS